METTIWHIGVMYGVGLSEFSASTHFSLKLGGYITKHSCGTLGSQAVNMAAHAPNQAMTVRV